MKKLFAILAVLFFTMSLAPNAQAQEKRAMKVVPKSQRYALLVGINEYNKPFTPLKYCEADMEALEKVLLEIGFPKENIVLLSTSAGDTSHLPTKANILRHARLLAEEVDKNGMFLMAFSGHGASYGNESYFCPMDAANKDLSSLVKRSDVYKIVENCPAKQKLILVDACRNSLVMEGWKATDGMKGLVDPVGIENPGFFIISSCKTGQYSWEDPKLGHGVFTHFLVEGLRGKAAQDSQISVLGLFSYVNLQTKRYVRLNFEESQIPLLRGDEDELDNFLIAKLKNSERTLPKQPEVVPMPIVTSPPVTHPEETSFPASSREAGERKVLTADGIVYAFRWCPPGEFEMGGGEGLFTQNAHKVTLTKGFWMLETEVTQAMWRSVMGKIPSHFYGDQNPVECVSWYECQEFCNILSKKLGQRVQLPTEAQWEYACCSGTYDSFYISSRAWYKNNSDNQTHAVGQNRPNVWGLYDMNGNVMEWCSDWFGYCTKSPTSDPTGPNSSGEGRVVRGGCYLDAITYCSSKSRSHEVPDYRRSSLGFRVLLVPGQGTARKVGHSSKKRGEATAVSVPRYRYPPSQSSPVSGR